MLLGLYKLWGCQEERRGEKKEKKHRRKRREREERES